MADKSGGSKNGDKANGKEKRAETPITMTVKKPTRPSNYPAAASSPMTPFDGMVPSPGAPDVGGGLGAGAGGEYGEFSSPGVAWGGAAHLNTDSAAAAAVSPSASMGAWGGRGMLKAPPNGALGMRMAGANDEKGGHGSVGMHQANGWRGNLGQGTTELAGAACNGGHVPAPFSQGQEEGGEEAVVANLLTAVFPGLSRATALLVHREGVAASRAPPR